MKISQLYTYPIKSLRPSLLTAAEATRHGLSYDRRFMLVKLIRDESNSSKCTFKNMHVVFFPEMTLFLTSIKFPEDDPEGLGRIHVTFQPPGQGQAKEVDIPLQPALTGLREIEVVMHRSATRAYDMGKSLNDWFSGCFGYEVILAYLGGNSREVLMSVPARENSSGSWLSRAISYMPFFGAVKDEITFADCAPYLVVSEESLRDVSNRLPEGQEMDVTKFRPNIVVQGADAPWEEDYWAEIQIGAARLVLVHNCSRCQSINIDYSTGRMGTDSTGRVLALLQKDRRVDAGNKYSPVFGRYGFLASADEKHSIAVGDHVTILKRNTERTKFDWPGLAKTM